MEDIFLAIQERIALKMPELSLVDEDYGQLVTEEDTYPVTFPCVLISTIDAVTSPSNWRLIATTTRITHQGRQTRSGNGCK